MCSEPTTHCANVGRRVLGVERELDYAEVASLRMTDAEGVHGELLIPEHFVIRHAQARRLMSQKRLSSVQSSRQPTRPKNRLLSALPAAEFRRLRPYLKTIPIRVKQVLHTRGKPLDAVYFLNGGAASITTTLSDGTSMEAATVGDEGMLGIEAFPDTDAVAAGDTLL